MSLCGCLVGLKLEMEQALDSLPSERQEIVVGLLRGSTWTQTGQNCNK